MLGSVIGVEENLVTIKLNVELDKIQSLINLHVIMEDEERKTVGEMIDIKDGIAYVNMLGEISGDRFIFGVTRKPSFSATVKLISKERIPMIIGVDNYAENKDLYLGESPIYTGVKIGVNINQFFSNHFAIFGSTGSGKSCSVARIFQNLFEKDTSIAYRASILIFDAYGEYHNAFSQLHEKVPEINFKTYTTNLHFSETEVLKIPLWLLGDY